MGVVQTGAAGGKCDLIRVKTYSILYKPRYALHYKLRALSGNSCKKLDEPVM